MKQLTFFILIISILNSCCFKCEDTCENNYQFESHYFLSPTSDSIKIGDTMWISCDFSTEFFDLKNNVSVNLANANLMTQLFISKIDEDPYIHNYSKFEIVEDIGQLHFFSLTGVSGYSLVHEIKSNQFKIKLGIIPEQIGLYNLTIYSPLTEEAEESEFLTEDGCINKIDQYDIILNNKLNNNYEFISKSPDERVRATIKQDFDRAGGFAFYVVE